MEEARELGATLETANRATQPKRPAPSLQRQNHRRMLAIFKLRARPENKSKLEKNLPTCFIVHVLTEKLKITRARHSGGPDFSGTRTSSCFQVSRQLDDQMMFRKKTSRNDYLRVPSNLVAIVSRNVF